MNQFAKPAPIVCKCGKGYGSPLDGLCTKCRGGITAWEAKRNITLKPHVKANHKLKKGSK